MKLDTTIIKRLKKDLRKKYLLQYRKPRHYAKACWQRK